MTARRREVSIGSLCGSSFIANHQQVHDLLCGLGAELSNSCNSDAFVTVVPQLQVPRCDYKQIADHLVINFDVGDVYCVVIITVLLD